MQAYDDICNSPTLSKRGTQTLQEDDSFIALLRTMEACAAEHVNTKLEEISKPILKGLYAVARRTSIENIDDRVTRTELRQRLRSYLEKVRMQRS